MTEGSAYIYDLDALGAWSRQVRAAVPAGIRVYYACKANPLSDVLRTLAREGYGFDVASPGELRQALRHAPGAPLLCTGPAKSEAFLRAALAGGATLFVLESAGQLAALEKLAAERGAPVKALLRLQLAWNEGKSVLGGASVSVFGLDAEGWTRALAQTPPKFVEIEGVHVFQWGNEVSLDRLAGIWDRVAVEATELARALGYSLKMLDLGGGLGLPYEKGQDLIAPEELGLVLAALEAKLPGTALLLELGRYLVGACGSYVTAIVDRKDVRGETFLVTEGGAQHLVRPALVGQSFPARLQRESRAPVRAFRVHGPLCTALDRLGTYELPGDAAPGDRLELSLAGAYGFTESMPFFLCHDGAAEMVRENGELRVVREPMKPEDWLR